MSSTIRSQDHMRQIVDFCGLHYARDIQPTDIDGLLDFGGKLFVFFELKHHVPTMSDPETLIPTGQRIALERVAEAVAASRPVVLVEAHHESEPWQDVDAAHAIVHRFRQSVRHSNTLGPWKPASEPMTLRSFIDRYVEFYAPECMP